MDDPTLTPLFLMAVLVITLAVVAGLGVQAIGKLRERRAARRRLEACNRLARELDELR